MYTYLLITGFPSPIFLDCLGELEGFISMQSFYNIIIGGMLVCKKEGRICEITRNYISTVLSRKYPPPPPPNSFDENYCAGTIISEDSDCD